MSRRENRYGGYDRTGRWRSEAWHMDGGANDEGWHYKMCYNCGKETEHGVAEGCVPCGDRAIRRSAGPRLVTVSGSAGDHTVRVYPNGKKYCSCKGFQYRKKCSHTAQAV